MPRRSKKKCRGCKTNLTPSFCWPDDHSQGWVYLFCDKAKCGVSSTERQGGRSDLV